MRFATRFDRGLVVLTVLAAIVTCVMLPAMALLSPGSRHAPGWASFCMPLIWLILLGRHVSSIP